MTTSSGKIIHQESVVGIPNLYRDARRRKPTFQFQCMDFETFFNVFTDTAFHGTRWPCSKVVMILRGFLKGDSTLSMSREMGLGYRNLLYLRHELIGNALDNRQEDILLNLKTEK